MNTLSTAEDAGSGWLFMSLISVAEFIVKSLACGKLPAAIGYAIVTILPSGEPVAQPRPIITWFGTPIFAAKRSAVAAIPIFVTVGVPRPLFEAVFIIIVAPPKIAVPLSATVTVAWVGVTVGPPPPFPPPPPPHPAIDSDSRENNRPNKIFTFKMFPLFEEYTV